MNCNMHFFLGTNTENGFFSLYDDFIYGIKNPYIIKGGPGTGKSTIIKKAGCKASEKGYTVEQIHCSSDPDSLDGIYIKEIDTCIIDGTAPHLVEPPYPGAVGQMIDLYKFWDSSFLRRHATEIKKINSDISAMYERAYLYIGAVGKLQKDLNKIGIAMTNKAKLKGFFERLCSKYIKQTDTSFYEEKRFISAITPKGYVSFTDIFSDTETKTLIIEDEYGISAKALEIIKYRAVKCGHKIITCYSPINPNLLEHLIIPTAKLNICTSNSLHTIKPEPYCRINISRFFAADAQKAHKEKINFLLRARDEIINEAVKLLKLCHKRHDELEEIYKTAVDFESLTKFTDALIKQIID